MPIEQIITTVHAPLAASIEPSAMGARTAVLLLLGIAAVVAVSAWRRRRQADRDPLRSLTPPAGPLRLARKLTMRSTTD